jgi:hypothetical protein
MSESPRGSTKRLLSEYLTEVRPLPDKSARAQRFVALVGQAFPGWAVMGELAAGQAVERRLREGCSGEPHWPLLAAASDGVVWRMCRAEGPPGPGDVTLEPLREVAVTE